MTDHDDLADIFEAFLTSLEHGTAAPDLTGLPDDVRIRVARQLELLREGHGVLAEHAALADDPVFFALGFDRAGTEINIDGDKLKRARKQAGIDYAEIVDRTRNAGADLTVKDLFRLERSASTPLPQVDATALVAALRTSLHNLESDASQTSLMRRFLDSDEFALVVSDWAHAHGMESSRATRRAQSELLAANFRGGRHLDLDDLHELLQAVLERMATHADDLD